MDWPKNAKFVPVDIDYVLPNIRLCRLSTYASTKGKKCTYIKLGTRLDIRWYQEHMKGRSVHLKLSKNKVKCTDISC